MAQDRNEKARQEFQLAQARKQFLQAVAAGQTGVVDRFGGILQVNDSLIYFPPRYGLIWQVKDVGPNLDPAVPPGQMKLTLVCETTVPVVAGRPMNDLLRVIMASGAVAEAAGGDPADAHGEQHAGPSEADVAAIDGAPVLPPVDEGGETRGPESGENQ